MTYAAQSAIPTFPSQATSKLLFKSSSALKKKKAHNLSNRLEYKPLKSTEMGPTLDGEFKNSLSVTL